MDSFSQMVSGLAVTMLGQTSTQAMLDQVARGAVAALPVDGASVMLGATVATPEYVAASDAAALRLERLQSSLNQGPCIVAQDSSRSVLVPDLAAEEGFPEFTAAARELGLRGVFSFPLRQGETSLGAFDLYRMSPGMLDRSEMLVAQTLADVLVAYVVNAQTRAVLEAAARREHGAVERQRALQEESKHFVASLVHELGNPIASIVGFSEMLTGDSEDLSAQQQRSVSAIHRNSERLRSLSAELLTLFSVDPAEAHADHTRVDLRAVVAAARATVDGASTEAALEVSVHVPATPVVVTGHPEHLERMVSNLLGNAVKYTPAGGSVTCVLSQEDAHATLEVRDTGIGIPEEEQDQLYTRFFRASTATERGIQGTGLGLAIVRSVVRGHRGTIAVTSAVGSGTRFVVRLPLARETTARTAAR